MSPSGIRKTTAPRGEDSARGRTFPVSPRPRAAGDVRVGDQRAAVASGDASVGVGAGRAAVCVAGVDVADATQHELTTTGALTTVVQPQLVWQ